MKFHMILSMDRRVAIVAQSDYESNTLEASVRRAVELSGFDIARAAGRRVLLKPNMLGAYPPATGVNTNPSFVRAVASLFLKEGADVFVGDSPNGVYPPDRVWDVSGIRRACADAGAKELSFEAGGSIERAGIMIAKAALDADILVNLPKFKTHSLTAMTLSVKNLFGCVNGMMKTRLHRENPTREGFARMLVRVAQEVKPALNIIDGVIAMDGDGPSAGRMVDLGVIVAGTDAHATDAACCRLIGIEPLAVDTLAEAKRMGIWDDGAPIEIVGDPLEELRPQRFSLPATTRGGMLDWRISRYVIGRIFSNMSAQPKIDPKACRRCRLCTKACPVAAIGWEAPEAAPEICIPKCMQCFCCHEICPHRAISIRKSSALCIARAYASVLSWRGKVRSSRRKNEQADRSRHRDV